MRNTRSILWFLLGALIGFAFCYTITTSGGRARPEDVAWAQRARIMREARVADARAEIAVERLHQRQRIIAAGGR